MSNKKIKNANSTKINELLFKSRLELRVYKLLSTMGFNVQYEPYTFTLWEGFKPLTPFYDQETNRQRVDRLKEDKSGSKSLQLIQKNEKIMSIKYTPDFYLEYNGVYIYIEAKGYENDVFYIKKKLFRQLLDDKLKNNGEMSMYFEVHTIKQLLQAVEIFKTYANGRTKKELR